MAERGIRTGSWRLVAQAIVGHNEMLYRSSKKYFDAVNALARAVVEGGSNDVISAAIQMTDLASYGARALDLTRDEEIEQLRRG